MVSLYIYTNEKSKAILSLVSIYLAKGNKRTKMRFDLRSPKRFAHALFLSFFSLLICSLFFIKRSLCYMPFCFRYDTNWMAWHLQTTIYTHHIHNIFSFYYFISNIQLVHFRSLAIFSVFLSLSLSLRVPFNLLFLVRFRFSFASLRQFFLHVVLISIYYIVHSLNWKHRWYA